MFIKKNSLVAVNNGENTFLVLDIKNVGGKEIALLQGVEDGEYRFALESIDEKKLNATLMFINDKEAKIHIAKEFDKQNKNNKKSG